MVYIQHTGKGVWPTFNKQERGCGLDSTERERRCGLDSADGEGGVVWEVWGRRCGLTSWGGVGKIVGNSPTSNRSCSFTIIQGGSTCTRADNLIKVA